MPLCEGWALHVPCRDEAAELPAPGAVDHHGQLGEGLAMDFFPEQLLHTQLIGPSAPSVVPPLQVVGNPLREMISDQIAFPSLQPHRAVCYTDSAEYSGPNDSHGGAPSQPYLFPAIAQPLCMVDSAQGADLDGLPSAQATRNGNNELPSWCLELFASWESHDAKQQW